MPERQRLHITPLNSELLPLILPTSVLSQASNISFHSIETFPERNYGFVDLPIIEAEKLKKQLNGSILKGSKMRVSNARPEGTIKPLADNATSSIVDEEERSKRRRSKRIDKAEGVVPGFQLPEGRKVKRGWSEPIRTSRNDKSIRKQKDNSKKGQKRNSKQSEFTEKPECLFKTTLPANVSSMLKSSSAVTKTRKRKRGQNGQDIMVHEFSNSSKYPSFLKGNHTSAERKGAHEFVEEKGWVDREGNVIESAPEARNIQPNSSIVGISNSLQRATASSCPGDSNSKLPNSQVQEAINAVGSERDDETSSRDSSASESDNENPSSGRLSPTDDVDEISNKNYKRDSTPSAESVSRIKSNKSTAPERSRGPNLNNVPPVPSFENNLKVHPLEALFKRPPIVTSSSTTTTALKKPALEVSTSFSFFDQAHEDSQNDSFLMPQTPFSQDIRARRQRSAAPTPDTAVPGRTSFGNVWGSERDTGNENEDNEINQNDNDDHKQGKYFDNADNYSDDEGDTKESILTSQRSVNKIPNAETKDQADQKPESEFAKWFWEHRGETNRAWKRRRREAAKEKRQKRSGKKETRMLNSQ